MGINTTSLKRIFSLPASEDVKVGGASLEVPDPPPGKSPPLDWGAVADSFIYDYYNSPERSAKRKQGVFHPSAGLHPSESHCLRLIVFDLMHAPRSRTSFTPQIAKILENGNNRHKGLNSLFSAMAEKQHMGIVKFDHDIPAIHPTLPIEGEADGRVYTRVGYRYTFDFKTINDKGFSKLYDTVHKHRIQLNTYMGILQEETGYMIYENKNNQKWATPFNPNFRVDFDPKMFRETEQYCFDILQNYVVAEVVPEFDQKLCDASFTFCGYVDVCRKQRSHPEEFDAYDFRPKEVKHRHLTVVQ